MSTSLIACLICPPLSTSLIACLIIRYVPMYPNPAKLERYAARYELDPLALPLIMCEYSHAMGNSCGGLREYWQVRWMMAIRLIASLIMMADWESTGRYADDH